MSKDDKNKLQQIRQIDAEIAAKLVNDTLKIENYFKDNNILNQNITIFESEWFNTAVYNRSRIYSKTIGTLLPQEMFPFEDGYTKELDIPDYLLPFVEVQLIVNPPIGSNVLSVYSYNRENITGEWVRIKGNGTIVYEGPSDWIPTVGNHANPHLFNDDKGYPAYGSDRIILIGSYGFTYTDPYPVVLLYKLPVYYITFRDIFGTLHSGLITQLDQTQHNDVDTPFRHGRYYENNGYPTIAYTYDEDHNIISSVPATLQIFSTSGHTITAGCVGFTNEGNTATRVTNTFDLFSTDVFLGYLESGQQYINGQNIAEILRLEQVGYFGYYDSQCRWILSVDAWIGGHNFGGEYTIWTPLIAENVLNSVPYSSMTVEENFAPWPRVITNLGDDLYRPDVAYSEYIDTSFMIKDFTLRNTSNNKYLLAIGNNATILLRSPATERVPFLDYLQASKTYGVGSTTPAQYPPSGQFPFTNYYETGGSDLKKSNTLYEPKEADGQIKVRVILKNPFFFKEDRKYKNV